PALVLGQLPAAPEERRDPLPVPGGGGAEREEVGENAARAVVERDVQLELATRQARRQPLGRTAAIADEPLHAGDGPVTGAAAAEAVAAAAGGRVPGPSGEGAASLQRDRGAVWCDRSIRGARGNGADDPGVAGVVAVCVRACGGRHEHQTRNREDRYQH